MRIASSTACRLSTGRAPGKPSVTGRGKGDLVVRIEAVTPRKLTREQRQLLEQLAKTMPLDKLKVPRREDEGEDKSVFDRVKDIFS